VHFEIKIAPLMEVVGALGPSHRAIVPTANAVRTCGAEIK